MSHGSQQGLAADTENVRNQEGCLGVVTEDRTGERLCGLQLKQTTTNWKMACAISKTERMAGRKKGPGGIYKGNGHEAR